MRAIVVQLIQMIINMFDPTHSRYRYLAFKNAEKYRRFIQRDDSVREYGPTFIESLTPAHGTYGALLFTPQWRAKREEILKRDAYKCVICSDTADLQVHHRQYHFIVRESNFRMPWDYSESLLITLCESCHKRGHSKFKVPIINL